MNNRNDKEVIKSTKELLDEAVHEYQQLKQLLAKWQTSEGGNIIDIDKGEVASIQNKIAAIETEYPDLKFI